MAHVELNVDREPHASGRPISEPLFETRPVECAYCRGCIRWCPARAIRMADGTVKIAQDRCVNCGVCASSCSRQGFSVRDDLPKVRQLLASGRTVVAMLAPEYIAALHPLTADEVECALLKIGFTAVETTILGEELVAAEYEKYMADPKAPALKLRSTCAVAVSWVRHYRPELVADFFPIVPPYIAQARLVRSLYPEDTAIVYVSPCWARKDEAVDPSFGDAVDVAIGFDELGRLLDEAQLSISVQPEPQPAWRPRPAKEISLTDGFPKVALSERERGKSRLLVVRGLKEIDDLLGEIVRGEVEPGMVDMLCCEGCLDGSAMNPEMSVFAKRSLIVADRERQPPQIVDGRLLLSALPAVDLSRDFSAEPAATRVPTAEELEAALEESGLGNEAINCGSCGYPTCAEHAAAVCVGLSTWELCLPSQRRLMERNREELLHTALTDALTGLGNRRQFDERLAEEVSRVERYGGTLSLIMIDLDGFKSINDTFGHLVGDTVLDAVGALLRQELRTADVPTRYGGDEFAVLLPDTTKTDAWVVAEKLRAALLDLVVDTPTAKGILTKASFGVAAFGHLHATAEALIAAADSALYVAKHSGRNRVEIALG
ncbi:MAG: diguanylate cyclase [Coriobacteriia bacterium]